MAKLQPPYTLCPLIEHRKCLGVSEDSTPGCVIVTLGKNIVIRYRLSDQKQVNSWSSKDQLSAPVIYDFNSKRYVAVFKCDQVAFWHDSLVQLNKLKKFKFSRLIHCVLSTKESAPVILYENGTLGILHHDLASRKSSKNVEEFLLEESEEILSANLVSICGHLHVSMLTFQKKSSVKTLYFVPVDADRADRFQITLKDEPTACFNAHSVVDSDSTTSLITLWSDGSIYSLELPLKDIKCFPGRFVVKIESVDLQQPAVMHSLGQQEVVIYGAAPNSEGAVICVFNLKYGLIDSSQKLKVYSVTPKLWVVGAIGTNRYILCLSGGHLVVIPTRFFTQKLCTLVGVAKIDKVEINSSLLPVVTASWKSNNKQNVIDNMEVDHCTLTNQVIKLRNVGFTDRMICEDLLPKLIENLNEEELSEFLTLVRDVPDNWLVEIVVKFNKNQQSTKLLKKILRRPLVSDNSSLQLVRSKVSFPMALDLLLVISNMMENNQLDKSLLEWACILLDSYYQQYLLSKNETIIDTFNKINSAVKLQMESLINMKSLYAELVSLKRGHIQSKNCSVSSHCYLIDTINLYEENVH